MKPQDQVTKVRIAMFQAADVIEIEPSRYDFDRCVVPECGTPGCMLGLMGVFLGYQAGEIVDAVCKKSLGISDAEFYRLVDKDYNRVNCWGDNKSVANALRQFAQEWQP